MANVFLPTTLLCHALLLNPSPFDLGNRFPLKVLETKVFVFGDSCRHDQSFAQWGVITEVSPWPWCAVVCGCLWRQPSLPHSPVKLIWFCNTPGADGCPLPSYSLHPCSIANLVNLSTCQAFPAGDGKTNSVMPPLISNALCLFICCACLSWAQQVYSVRLQFWL